MEATNMLQITFSEGKNLKKKLKISYVVIGILLVFLLGTILSAGLVVSHLTKRNESRQKVALLALDKEVLQENRPRPMLPVTSAVMSAHRPQKLLQKQRVPHFFTPTTKRNKRNRRVTGKRPVCNTAIPKCYEENKKFRKFAEQLDIQIYFSDIFRRIMTLLCIYAKKPLYCEVNQLREDKLFVASQQITLKNVRNNIQVLQDSSNVLTQFTQSLKVQLDNEKSKKKPQREIVFDLTKIVENFTTFANTMDTLKTELVSCSSCISKMTSDIPTLQQFNSMELDNRVKILKTSGKAIYKGYSDDELKSQQIMFSLFEFLRQMVSEFKQLSQPTSCK